MHMLALGTCVEAQLVADGPIGRFAMIGTCYTAVHSQIHLLLALLDGLGCLQTSTSSCCHNYSEYFQYFEHSLKLIFSCEPFYHLLSCENSVQEQMPMRAAEGNVLQWAVCGCTSPQGLPLQPILEADVQ